MSNKEVCDGSIPTRRYVFRDLTALAGPITLLIIWLASLRQLPGDLKRVEESVRDIRATVERIRDVQGQDLIAGAVREQRLTELERILDTHRRSK